MGFLDLFNPQPTTPTIPSVLPESVKQQILRGKLPILEANNLFLKNGETCHYADRAIYEKRTVSKRGFARIPVTVCLDCSKVHEFMLVVVIQNMLMM